MNSRYDSDRISKIETIMPGFIAYAAVGDEVELGLKGDPCYPYGDGPRPLGTIESIYGGAERRGVEILLTDGTRVRCDEDDYRPSSVWEYTSSGYRGVMDREEAERKKKIEEKRAAEEKETMPSDGDKPYRGTQDQINELKHEIAQLRDVTFTAMEGLASDIKYLGTQEPKFAGALLREMQGNSSDYKALSSAANQFDFATEA